MDAAHHGAGLILRQAGRRRAQRPAVSVYHLPRSGAEVNEWLTPQPIGDMPKGLGCFFWVC